MPYLHGVKMHIWVGTCLLAGLATGCNPLDTGWESEWLAPVARTELNLDQLTGDTLLSPGPDGLLWVDFQTEILDFGVDTLADLGDYSSSETAVWPLGDFQVTPGSTLPLNDIVLKFDAEPAELTYALVKSGTLRVELVAALPEKVEALYQIPMARKNGLPLIIKETIPAVPPGGDSVRIVRTLNLADWEMDLRTLNLNKWNELAIQVQVTLPLDANPLPLTQGQFLMRIQTDMLDLKPRFAQGYFGQQTLQIQNPVALDALNKIKVEQLLWDQAEIDLSLQNYLGADLRVRPLGIDGKKTSSGQEISLQHPVFGTTVNVSRAQGGLTVSQPQPTQKTWQFNPQNSNILDFLQFFPDQITPRMVLDVNPLGNISGHRDFLYPAFPPKLKIQVKAPLAFSVGSMVFTDTLDANFEGNTATQSILGGNLKLVADNGFPFALEVTSWLLDAQGLVVDSLVSGQEIAAAPLAVGSNFSQQTTRTILNYPVSPALGARLAQVRHIRVKAWLRTMPAGQTISVLPQNTCALQWIAQLTVNPNP